jgi:hypothetical protein
VDLRSTARESKIQHNADNRQSLFAPRILFFSSSIDQFIPFIQGHSPEIRFATRDRGNLYIPRRNSSPHPSQQITAPMSRSFTGCKRCKARRQKCDEQRPNCGRCQTAGEQCQYAMQLQWGGRAFSRSRFGACVGTGGMERLGM